MQNSYFHRDRIPIVKEEIKKLTGKHEDRLISTPMQKFFNCWATAVFGAPGDFDTRHLINGVLCGVICQTKKTTPVEEIVSFKPNKNEESLSYNK